MATKIYCIGLTGGIASGKSTAVSFFKDYGAAIIDADLIARTLTEKDKPTYQLILDHFSPLILESNGNIDRTKLRQIVFDNAEEKEWLESCLHPLIHQEIKKQLDALSITSYVPYVIIDIPLLINRTDFSFLNRILVIDCPEALQIERLCQRSALEKEGAKQIIETQISRKKRNILADDLILNDKSVDDLQRAVARLHKQYSLESTL
jgi:dephospho-CoA kinase